MSLEENKAIIRKAFEAVNKRNLAMLDEVYAPDYVDNFLQVRSLESFKEFLTEAFEGFPDLQFTIEDIVAEGDKVCVYYTETMTHTGEFEGIAPTGKKITYSAVCINRVVDGKIVEREGFGNDLDYYKQLGVIEYTEKGKKLFPEEAK